MKWKNVWLNEQWTSWQHIHANSKKNSASTLHPGIVTLLPLVLTAACADGGGTCSRPEAADVLICQLGCQYCWKPPMTVMGQLRWRPTPVCGAMMSAFRCRAISVFLSALFIYFLRECAACHVISILFGSLDHCWNCDLYLKAGEWWPGKTTNLKGKKVRREKTNVWNVIWLKSSWQET